MTGGLTPKQKRVLDFIEAYTAEHGYAPSQQEIAGQFGFQSLGTVQNYLVRLEGLGLLRRAWNGRRSLEVRRPRPEANEVPLLGRVAAGAPLEAVAVDDTLEVPSWMLGAGESFALRVRGDSMVGEGILDGDYVLVKAQTGADDGATVVAVVDGEATVKTLHRVRGRLELRAANPAYSPIEVRADQDFRVLGVVVGVLRRCVGKRSRG